MLRKIAGTLIFAMILFTVLQGLGVTDHQPVWFWVSGICAWAGAFLLVRNIPPLLKIQVTVLLTTGVVFLVIANAQGANIIWHQTVSNNTALLTMIAAVGFLRLVALPSETKESLPTGRHAYLQTLLGVCVFSSVINVSAPILIADRIHRQRALTRFTSQSITRVFCGMSNWSPFFGAMAAILTFVEHAELKWIIVAGLPFALVGVLLVYSEARIRYQQEMDDFVGYPFQFQALKIPLYLMLLVISGSYLLHDVSILVIIALSAILLTIALLIIRVGIKGGFSNLTEFVFDGLPRMIGELILFLAAGVLAVGISALLQVYPVTLPLGDFSAGTASLVLGTIMVAAALGIHPIILISSLTPLILTLNPNPTLLAFAYLVSWNLGTGSSYLSGTHLVFQGRYNIPSWRAASWNWPYALVMFAIAVIWMHLISDWLPGFRN